MFEIMFYPLMGLFGIALLSGAFGCQMMWHKVACLSDTLSHGALLAVAFGVLIGISENISLFLLSFLWAFLLWFLTKNRQNSTDTVMAFLTQSSIALAILLFSLAGQNSSMMHAFLGDVLMIDKNDILFIFGIDIILGVILIFCWKKWVLIAVSPDLAKSLKINTNLQQLLFFISAGFFVAQAMRLMGALLAPAFFVIPAMTARYLSKTPEKMAFLASFFAVLTSLIGSLFSFYLDLPTGVCVVICCIFLYLVVTFYRFIKKLLNKYLTYCS